MKRSLGWVVGAATVLALATPAWARDDDDYRRSRRGSYGRSSFTFERGYDRGYHEGAKDGARDGRSRHFNLYRDGTYRDGDQGYRSSYGPRWEYTRGFRRGYEEGYRRGFSSRRRHGYDDDRYGNRDYRDRDRIYESPRYR
jgi:hypothetical protein